MYISLTKNALQKIITQLTGVVADELELLDIIAQFCDDPSDIKNAKILFLVGCGKLYPVNGVSFDNKQEILEKMKDGDILQFVKEPENEHDKNAIKVLFNDEHIGYIPKNIAEILQDCIDDLCGEVAHVVGSKEADSNLGLRFVFRRKESIERKQLVSLDTVSYLLEDIQEKTKKIITTAQMLNIINNEYEPEKLEIPEDSNVQNNVEKKSEDVPVPPNNQNILNKNPKKEEEIF